MQTASRDRQWNVRIVLAGRFAMSAARALTGVVTPIYLAVIGFSAVRLGVLFLTVAATSAVLATAVGAASDRVGGKPFLIVMPLLTAAAAVTFAVSDRTAALFVAAALGSFGRGSGAGAGAVGPYQPAESAFAAEAVPAAERNSLFGRLAFFASLGAFAGGLLALLARESHTVDPARAVAAFRPAFLAVAALCTVAAAVALGLAEPRDRHHGRKPQRGALLPRRSRRLLTRLWITNSLNGLAVGMFGPFLTYWFYRRYGVGAGEIGVLYAIVNVASLPSTLGAAGLAHRFGTVRTTASVRVVQSLLLVPMALSPTFLLAGGVYVVRMAAQRIGLPLRQSYVVAMADPRERARVTALSQVPAQATSAIAPVFAGYLFEHVSLTLPIELASLLQLSNAALFYAFFRHQRPEEERGDLETTPGDPPDQPAIT
ncbi:MAG TPA: MFS transporter [Actinomycetota bacterium]